MTDANFSPPFKFTPETEPFWQAAKERRLLIRRCPSCDRAHWYPRVFCPFCHDTECDWVEADGKGTVYSYSVNARVEPKQVLALVTLAEGPTLLTAIVGCDPDAVKIGQAVVVDFTDAGNTWQAPVFRPA